MDNEKIITQVKALQAGDRAAAGQLYEACYQDIYYFIFKTVKERELAEDLTQDTFIKIMENIGQLQEPGAFTAWSRQIAYHGCTAYFRKHKELLLDENEDGSTVLDTVTEENAEFIPHEALDREDLKQTILAMIDSLPEEQRAAVLLRYYEELPVSQIAQIQQVSEGTVKSRLNYGRKAIRKTVEEYEKKHNVRLHSIAILPLLLWVFRKQKLQKGVSITASAGASAAAGTAAGAAAAAAAAKGLFSTVAGKVIAAALAVAVIGGGIAIVKNAAPEDGHGMFDPGQQTDQENGEEIPADDGLVDFWLLTKGNDSVITYDERGNMIDRVSSIRHWEFTYDDNDRMLTSKMTKPDGSVGQSSTYTYDANGNRTTETQNRSGYDYVFDYTWTYDDQGNMLSQTLGNVKDTYTYENGLCVSHNHEEAGEKLILKTYTYDGNGRMTKMVCDWNADPEVSYYVLYEYDADGNLIHEIIYEMDGTEDYRRSYTYENGLVVYEEDTSNTNNSERYVYDEHGNLIQRFYAEADRLRWSGEYTCIRVTPERAEELAKVQEQLMLDTLFGW